MTSGTFLVVEADADSAVVRDVASGRVSALASNPDLGLAVGDVVSATLEPETDLELTWVARDVDPRDVTVERASDPPGHRAVAAAGDDIGDLVTLEAATGETHVLTVPPDRTAAAAEEVVADAATVERAARLGCSRVEVRGADGVVSVRYR